MIATLDEAIKLVQDWKKQELRIVFTNGCFDILHVGHVDLLERCAQYGDKLVIGLNSDSSVKAIKGENRPINNEQDRGRVLSALRFVDLVVIFSEPTPYNLIKALLPDILIKGGDWTVDNIVGKDIVEGNHGQVFSLPLLDKYSTTNLIERINQTRF